MHYKLTEQHSSSSDDEEEDDDWDEDDDESEETSDDDEDEESEDDEDGTYPTTDLKKSTYCMKAFSLPNNARNHNQQTTMKRPATKTTTMKRPATTTTMKTNQATKKRVKTKKRRAMTMKNLMMTRNLKMSLTETEVMWRTKMSSLETNQNQHQKAATNMLLQVFVPVA